MESRLEAEQEAELRLLGRAAHDLCLKSMELPLPAASMVSALTESLVRTALLRAKPDRRIPHLEQWRQFLAWLADSLPNAPEKQRPQIAEKAIREFELLDRRGKSKPKSQIPAGANCLLLKDNALWF